MRIEAVVVCVDYSDFLCWTLPLNKHHFDKMVVVTAEHDLRTRKLCEYHHVQCVVTDRFYENGDPFNKGKGINVGLKALEGADWVVHMDADILLPPLFRKIVTSLPLDPETIYGVDRMMCDGFDNWLDYFIEPRLTNEADIYVHLSAFPTGVRIAKEMYGQWVPIGFFQSWNQGRMKLRYPEEHSDAARSDILMSLQFPREKRQLLPEIVAIHLASGRDMGANWRGRRTSPFGPAKLEVPTPVEPGSEPDQGYNESSENVITSSWD